MATVCTDLTTKCIVASHRFRAANEHHSLENWTEHGTLNEPLLPNAF